ncbi:hypothetical protein BDQ17DRAFT_1352678 [Cyathus striatus]|nr:hypothetical protein BDQ17DRAFT_1352678 [Cyathus striatus]
MLPHLLLTPPTLNLNTVPEPPRQSAALALHDQSYFAAPIPNFAALTVSPTQSASSADTVDDDRIPSPQSPLPNSGNYHYELGGPASFHPALPSTDMYDNNSAPYPASPPSYAAAPHSHQAFTDIDSGAIAKDSAPAGTYLSDSPSPVDNSRPTTFPHPFSAPHTQERFLHSDHQTFSEEPDRLDQSDSLPDRYSRLNKYSVGSHSQSSLLDQRRMSEPAVLGGASMYATASSLDTGRYDQFNHTYNPSLSNSCRTPSSIYVPPLHRGASIGSLRDLRQIQSGYSASQSHLHSAAWKQNQDRMPSYSSTSLDEPISPLQPNFSGGLVASPTSGVPYSPGAENLYGPSPPGTGTSTSSNPALGLSFNPASSQSSMSVQRTSSIDQSPSKTYSFVALPGNAVKKRPRRRYDEIERLYQCSWPDCSKAYGTLNHLNAHVTMQKHGPKRNPNEFKELRKQWRKAKKESESSVNSMRRANISNRSDDNIYGMHRYNTSGSSTSLHQQSMHNPAPGLPSSLSIPQQGSGQRYSVSIEDIRYPIHDRDDLVVNYGHMSARQRYSTGLPASWHPGSSLPTRHESYMSAGGINQSHPSQPTPLPINSLQPPAHTQGRPPSPSHSQPPTGQLPADSTLFTPLPGYQPPSLLPPLQHGGGDMAGYHYKVYDEESGRPSTGHASLGPTSGDEYDR